MESEKRQKKRKGKEEEKDFDIKREVSYWGFH